MRYPDDTIVALSTPVGSGALGVIRLSGSDAILLADSIFSKDLTKVSAYRVVYGKVMKGDTILDEVLVSVFRAPRSFTKEDVVEISCHGSSYILREVIQLLVQAGARLAEAGEFTQRAFLNGAMDLAQAEAVADLIAASSSGAHRVAMTQMRGGVSSELSQLREQLLNFTSLIELELDFGEEDVEFADRSQLEALIQRMQSRIATLIQSFQLGNALKQGVPTVILGKPNAGKSTLLNALLNDNRAIVSDIPGTTRDVIEDRIVLQGIEFRLMDTAGVRDTTDVIEAEGVSRSLKLAQEAQVVLYVFDLQTESPPQAQAYIQSLALPAVAQVVLIGNKLDLVAPVSPDTPLSYPFYPISAKNRQQLTLLTDWMVHTITHQPDAIVNQPLISNVRHLHALQQAQASLAEVQQGMDMGVSGDLLAIDIRRVLHFIGEITGEITTDEVLGNIFSKFCIGK